MANPSHGALIDKLLRDYLHSDSMRDKVAEAAYAADAFVKASIAPHSKSGTLFRDSSAQVEEFEAGYGMLVSTLWLSYFNWNRAGIRRLREPGYRRGAGIRRKRGYKAHAPVMHVHSPSVFGDAVEVFSKQIGAF